MSEASEGQCFRARLCWDAGAGNAKRATVLFLRVLVLQLGDFGMSMLLVDSTTMASRLVVASGRRLWLSLSVHVLVIIRGQAKNCVSREAGSVRITRRQWETGVCGGVRQYESNVPPLINAGGQNTFMHMEGTESTLIARWPGYACYRLRPRPRLSRHED